MSTVKDLMDYAGKLGISKKDAKKILVQNGVTGKFDPKRYGEYQGILSTHSSILGRILSKVTSGSSSSDKCPICGADKVYESLSDGQYGVPRGWRCSSGEPHFTEWAWKETKEKSIQKKRAEKVTTS